jgi:hypothetical protein
MSFCDPRRPRKPKDRHARGYALQVGPLKVIALATIVSLLAGAFLFPSPVAAASGPLRSGGQTSASHVDVNIPGALFGFIASALVATVAIGAIFSLTAPRRRDGRRT